MGVFRCFVEKKPGFDGEARGVFGELSALLGLTGLTGVRLFRRYDVEGIAPQHFRRARHTVFSEPQVDEVYDDSLPPIPGPHALLAVEALPGQFDQRADSAAQCIQMLVGGERPLVRCATVYVLQGQIAPQELDRVKGYLINPVESREASLEARDSLAQAAAEPPQVPTVQGFRDMDGDALERLSRELGLAMDMADLRFLQTYFREEGRDPTLTEVRVVDTYWSDHCRHTTFSTHLDSIQILDKTAQEAYERYLALRREVFGEKEAAVRPQTLMDLATLGAKALKKRGLLQDLDESEEINACSIRVTAQVNGVPQDWLLLFKNETHNHPTEIEPFGGAATCIGGCIRDPLSGRAYVYQAMRVTGGGDPRQALADTLPGKLPQRKLLQTAAAGYSSYGNQIGLATGLVDEVYHPGYVAKHLEVGAVVGAAPADHVTREVPAPGDVVILLGGRTGRDGIGGATGSSKSHDLKSLDTMASEVQKGNAPEERKIQRLFRDGNVTRLIKRCNDFGAGGVSVAIGELADGLAIDLDAVRKKYDGLDGTELAISESQERMAVVVASENVDAFIAAADRENLEAYPVATVTEKPRMVMTWRGQTVADLSRAFLNTNGAVKRASVTVPVRENELDAPAYGSLREMASSLACASRRGLSERFDSTIGAGSVLAPYGGKTQRSPAQVMAALLPVAPGEETDACSVMSWGFHPEEMERDPYRGAYHSVVLSLAKLVAAGCDYRAAYLTFQEYFEKLRDDPARWGKPFAALLGALDAQMDFQVAAIGGKDSMSGSFMDLDVPPTLISFAVVPAKAGDILSPEFKGAGHPVYLFSPREWDDFHALCRKGQVLSAWAVEYGLAEGLMKMGFGNDVGFRGENFADWFTPMPGYLLGELTQDCPVGKPLGRTTGEPVLDLGTDKASLAELSRLNEGVLKDVYPTQAEAPGTPETYICREGSPVVAKCAVAKPQVVIPVFPGTNCEYDSARACLRAGLDPQVVVIRNLTPQGLQASTRALESAIRRAQIVFLPGGFSGGDEPDGSAKFICSLFRASSLADAVHDLLKSRDGLMLGICNGFQALIKLGLVPFGEIRDMDGSCPTLTYNLLNRHQSMYVTTRVASVRSPWMLKSRVGQEYVIPISHGEGRFVCSEKLLAQLAERGQIATQYVDLAGRPAMDTAFNPNGSVGAVEGIFSPDGRVLGKMGHSERRGPFLGKNIPGEKFQPLLESAMEYYK